MSEAAELAKTLGPALAQVAALMVPKALWSLDDIAVQLGRSIRLVRGYAARPDFPKAIRIAGSGHPLYKAKEVMAWVDKWQERN